MHPPRHLRKADVQPLVRQALAEDVGSGDATTLALVPPDHVARGIIRSRQPCTVAGLLVTRAVFEELSADIILEDVVADGEACPAGHTIATVTGDARAILTGERTALNFLQRLCGIATLTRAYADALGDSRTRILDTRKTTPGLRCLEKYAVTCGGGENHRFGLHDRVMVKDNHRLFAQLTGPGGIGRAVAACREQYPALQVEVEADTLAQADDAIRAGADYVLLDNMTDDELRQAVRRRNEHDTDTLLEASGGITLARLPALAAIGLDFISCGALTHSVPAVDIGLDLEVDPDSSPQSPIEYAHDNR